MADTFPSPIPEAISLAYEVSPGLGTQLQTAATQMWGDPETIRKHARSWAALAERVDKTTKDTQAEIREVGQDWEGSAAHAYKNWMQTLNDESIQVLSGQFKQISTILDGTADDVSAMNQQFTDLCFYFILTLGGVSQSPTGIGQTNMAGALLAGVKFGDRLNKFRNAYIRRLQPRTQALRQIATGINNGSIGRRVQHQPDLGHPTPYYTQEFADSYQWHTLGDWRNWKMAD
jgi:uncharacterized protein YukE